MQDKKEILKKAINYTKDKDVALFVELVKLQNIVENIATKVENLENVEQDTEILKEILEESKKKDFFISEELKAELQGKDAEITQEQIEKLKQEILKAMPKPENGKDYKLTVEDMEVIAGMVDVPVVEKVVEKIEVVKEIPNEDTAENIKEKLESLKDDDRLDASAIKNLPKNMGGKYYGGSGIKEVVAGTNVTVDNTNLGYPVINAVGGGSSISVNTAEVTDPDFTDSAEIEFGVAGSTVTASIAEGSIDETKLDTSVNASLDLADSSLQNLGTTVDNALVKTNGVGGTIQQEADSHLTDTGWLNLGASTAPFAILTRNPSEGVDTYNGLKFGSFSGGTFSLVQIEEIGSAMNTKTTSATLDSVQFDGPNGGFIRIDYEVTVCRLGVTADVYKGTAIVYISAGGVHTLAGDNQYVADKNITGSGSFTIGIGGKGAYVTGQLTPPTTADLATFLNYKVSYFV